MSKIIKQYASNDYGDDITAIEVDIMNGNHAKKYVNIILYGLEEALKVYRIDIGKNPQK